MTKVAEVQAQIAAQQAIVQKVKEGLKTLILELPDNPRIQRRGPACFTISSKDFGTGNWTAEYHDFKRQYNLICDMIERTAPEKLTATLETIIKDGKMRGAGDDRGRTIQLHPDVVENLRKLLL